MVIISRIIVPENERQYRLDPTVTQQKDIDLTLYRFKTDNGMQITQVVFHCRQENYWYFKDKKEDDGKNDFLKKVHYRLVGPYLVFRRPADGLIRIRKIIAESEDEQIPGPEKRILLSSVLKTLDDKKYVAFSALPTGSF